MNNKLENNLIEIAIKKIPNIDMSHDFSHAMRVLSNAKYISKKEGGDLDILIPSALFHDIIVYPKGDPKQLLSQHESAEVSEQILNKIIEYPKEKINLVKKAIIECSFTKGIIPNNIESQILQDADGLEATGAISIMRTYSSTGQMQRPFYSAEDPFCEYRKPDAVKYALDLFFERLLKVEERMHTKTAKEIAKKRTKFLISFLNEFKNELEGK